MVGASGAIGGVMGAYVVLYPRVHVHMLVFLGFFVTTIAVPAYLDARLLVPAAGLERHVRSGREGGGVAFWAHVGGFVAGALLCFVFRNRGCSRATRTTVWRRHGRRRRTGIACGAEPAGPFVTAPAILSTTH